MLSARPRGGSLSKIIYKSDGILANCNSLGHSTMKVISSDTIASHTGQIDKETGSSGRKPQAHSKTLRAYDPVQKLGEGGFAKVYLVKEQGSGNYFAMKMISKKAKHKKHMEHIKNEIESQVGLDHAFILELEAVYHTETNAVLILEYMECGDLFNLISLYEVTIPKV